MATTLPSLKRSIRRWPDKPSLADLRRAVGTSIVAAGGVGSIVMLGLMGFEAQSLREVIGRGALGCAIFVGLAVCGGLIRGNEVRGIFAALAPIARACIEVGLSLVEDMGRRDR